MERADMRRGILENQKWVGTIEKNELSPCLRTSILFVFMFDGFAIVGREGRRLKLSNLVDFPDIIPEQHISVLVLEHRNERSLNILGLSHLATFNLL